MLPPKIPPNEIGAHLFNTIKHHDISTQSAIVETIMQDIDRVYGMTSKLMPPALWSFLEHLSNEVVIGAGTIELSSKPLIGVWNERATTAQAGYLGANTIKSSSTHKTPRL